MLEYFAKPVLLIQNFFAQTPLLKSFWRGVSNFSVIVAIFVFIVLYLCISRRTGRVMFISFITSLLISSVIKIIVQEPRPFIYDPRILNLDKLSAVGFSFPSSHCIFFTSFVVSLTYEYRAKAIIYSSLIMVLLLSLSRVVLGAHYIHDCAFSIFVAILVSFVVSFLYYSHRLSPPKINITASIISLLVILSLHFFLINKGIKLYNNVFYCMEGLVSFLIGDSLERRNISVSCSARVLKRVIRFVFFVITSAGLLPFFYMFRSITNYTIPVFIVFYSIYGTYLFTKLAIFSNLFERP